MKRSGVVKLASTAIIRHKLMVFVNALVENPAFEGQTKDALITKPALFGASSVLSKEFLSSVVKHSGIVEQVLSFFFFINFCFNSNC